jgi:hypothetical protein
VQARVLVFENRVAAACQAYPASVRASREVLPVQSRRSQGAVNARRRVSRGAQTRCNGPSSREDRCALAMRVVGSGKVVGVPGAHAFVPKPGEGAVALGVSGYAMRRLVRSNGSRHSGWSCCAGARTPTKNVRGRSKSGQGQTSPPKRRGWPVPGRMRGRRARPSAV